MNAGLSDAGKLSVTEFLRSCFQTDLDGFDFCSFLGGDTKRALAFVEQYRDYLSSQSDFRIPTRKSGEIRPFFWDAVYGGGNFEDGELSHPIKQSLLLYNSILTTDPLDVKMVGAEQVLTSSDGYADAWIKSVSLALNSITALEALIDAGIIDFVSDRAAYRYVRSGSPAGRAGTYNGNWYEKFIDSDIEAYARPLALETFGGVWAASDHPKMLGYFEVMDFYDSNIAATNVRNDWLVRTLFEYWSARRAEPVALLPLQYSMNLNLNKTSVEDLVALRQSELVFAEFRSGLNSALVAASEQEFRESLHFLVVNLNNKPNPVWWNDAKSVGFAALGVGMDTIAAYSNAPMPPGVTTGVGTTLQIIENRVSRALAQSKERARTAVVSLATSIMT
ncbi:MAG: hypothetical protein R3C30_08665 [Hyphomonadaceae bacterium]